MPLEWDRDKAEIWSCIRTANFVDGDYFEARRNALVGLGYDQCAVESLLACERRGMTALKGLTNVCLDEYFGLVSPEEARQRARPYLEAYNGTLEEHMKMAPPPAPQP